MDSKADAPIVNGKNSVCKGVELAIFGGGKMEPMAVGGTRKVIIPPKLGCIDDFDVPPDSLVDATITIVTKRSMTR